MDSRNVTGFKLKILMIATIMMAFVGISEAFSQVTNVYKIQSLFLYNFSKHVKWENTEGSTFTVGIYNNSKAFAEIKANLGSKTVWGKKINVIQVTSPAELSKCHLAYMPKSNKKKILNFVESADLSNTLLVTEDDLMKEGAAISFIFEQSKMNFKISKSKIEQVGLKVSGSLLSIGIAV